MSAPAPAHASPSAPADQQRLPRPRAVGAFIAIAYGAFVLFALPFWFLDGGITHPLYSVIISLGMFTPALASLLVSKLVTKESWRKAVGLRFRGRWKQLLIWAPLGALVVIGINLASAVLLVLRGVPGDLSGATWARTNSDVFAEAGAPLPVAAVVALVLVGTVINLLITVFPALGEEIGWRGWLWRELKPLGTVRSVVIGGVVWSLWHLPVTLLGHNYPGQNRLAAAAMFLLACIAMNYLFGAITERARGNPIPAAFAHAALNSTLGLAISIVATDATVAELNWFVDTPLGVTGIALMLIAGFAIMPRRAGEETDQGVPGPESGERRSLTPA